MIIDDVGGVVISVVFFLALLLVFFSTLDRFKSARLKTHLYVSSKLEYVQIASWDKVTPDEQATEPAIGQLPLAFNSVLPHYRFKLL